MVLMSSETGAFVRRFATCLVLASAMLLMSCGSSEEAMMDDEGFEEEPVAQGAEPAADQSGDQQALTSFIGAAPKKEEPVQEQPVEPPPPVQTEPVATTPTNLQMENTSLKQQIVKLEQDTRNLGARLSDAEAKYMAEKQRADKAEEAARVAAQSAAISARSASTPVSREAESAYDEALQTFQMKAYDEAAMKFQNLLTAGVGSSLEDNCHYWIGESKYGSKNYAEAVSHFEMVLKYEDSEKLADAHFMLAQCYERMGDKVKAKQEYEAVARDFPMSANATRAKNRSLRL